MERAGKVYEAIQYYRKAVQLDPDIEHKIDYRPKYPLKDPETDNFEGKLYLINLSSICSHSHYQKEI